MRWESTEAIARFSLPVCCNQTTESYDESSYASRSRESNCPVQGSFWMSATRCLMARRETQFRIKERGTNKSIVTPEHQCSDQIDQMNRD